MTKHIVKDVEFIECPYCEKGPKNRFKLLHWKHLRALHNKTLEDVMVDFPGIPTMTLTEFNKKEKVREMAWAAKKEAENKTKVVKCCICGKEVDVNINVSNNYFVCQSCKDKGYKKPNTERTYQKQKEGMLKKYGVENPSQLKGVVNKRQGIVQRKKEEDPNYFEETKKKREKTLQEKFGEDWTKVVNKMSKDGMVEKYGVEHALQKEEFKEKAKTTYIERTGYENAMHNPEVKAKIVETNIKRRGVSNPMQDKEVREKAINTNLERRGVQFPTQSEEVKKKIKQKQTEHFIQRMNKILDLYKLEILDEYKDAHSSYSFKCKVCNKIFTKDWNAIQQGYKCPVCNPKQYGKKSLAQFEVEEFIKSLEIDFQSNNRELISPQELDIVIPEQKIAIEYCGMYFHSYNVLLNSRPNIKDIKKYHYYKWKLCKDIGYRLITIFEDEWLFKKEIVKERLKYSLNKSNSNKINARDCIIKEIEPNIKNEFLEKYHIQGKDSSNVKIGAFFNGDLVSVMTFSHGSRAKGIININKKVWELNRFCSDFNYNIRGISSKLLEYFKRKYNWEVIYTYADLRWSNGDLYRKLEFQTSEKVSLNYWYIDLNKLKRIHRFALRKRPDEPKNITEIELRIKDGYTIIWDCGNLKFILENPNVKKNTISDIQDNSIDIDEKEFKRKTIINKHPQRKDVGFADNESARKTRQKIQEKYGSENIMKTEWGKNRFKESYKNKYGVDNPMKLSEISKKVSDKLKGKESKLKGRNYEEIHGKEKSEDVKRKKSEKLRKRFMEVDMPKSLKPRNIKFLDKEYFGRDFKHNYKCEKCGTTFRYTWEEIKKGFNCPTCFPRFKTKTT